MYLTLLATSFLYNTTTKGTVYVHTQAHMGGCCAARGTHDAVPGDEQTRHRHQSCRRGDLARPAGSGCRSHREADGYELSLTDGCLSRSRCSGDEAVSGVPFAV